MIDKKKKPFWDGTKVAIFSALLGSGTTILVALIGKLGYNRSTPCPPLAISSLRQDTGTQNQVNQNENKGQIQNEFVSGNKTNNSFKVVDSSKQFDTRGKNVNTGTNNGIIGDNGTLVKEEKFHPNNDVIKRIVKALNTKEDFVLIKYEGAQQKRNREYALELISKLAQIGYKNVKLTDDLYNWNDPNKGVQIISPNSGTLILFVNMY